eukprot:TRINITY_DN440_c1_g2_i1.p1 TRINITY_DN440_c1_g2~~TRINITY_DN440_c1_g2_i1.p1  ORF type:complete len:448 (-),score=134.89 TRINITY_DN440_c1_g2_i1:492-1835(-)
MVYVPDMNELRKIFGQMKVPVEEEEQTDGEGVKRRKKRKGKGKDVEYITLPTEFPYIRGALTRVGMEAMPFYQRFKWIVLGVAVFVKVPVEEEEQTDGEGVKRRKKRKGKGKDVEYITLPTEFPYIRGALTRVGMEAMPFYQRFKWIVLGVAVFVTASVSVTVRNQLMSGNDSSMAGLWASVGSVLVIMLLLSLMGSTTSEEKTFGAAIGFVGFGMSLVLIAGQGGVLGLDLNSCVGIMHGRLERVLKTFGMEWLLISLEKAQLVFRLLVHSACLLFAGLLGHASFASGKMFTLSSRLPSWWGRKVVVYVNLLLPWVILLMCIGPMFEHQFVQDDEVEREWAAFHNKQRMEAEKVKAVEMEGDDGVQEEVEGDGSGDISSDRVTMVLDENGNLVNLDSLPNDDEKKEKLDVKVNGRLSKSMMEAMPRKPVKYVGGESVEWESGMGRD